jgi:riboflavin kinase/FMN adenylyltransferase
MRISHGFPSRQKPAAVTIGNFDGIHLGHQAMLKRLTDTARARGLESCVLTFEPHPREFFAPDQAPARLTSLREKFEILASLGVDHTHVCRFNGSFSRLSAIEFVERVLSKGLNARWVLIGDDFRFGSKRVGDFSLLQEVGPRYGFESEAMHSVMVDGHRASSTAVRDALAAGKLEWAAQLLGRPYSISGRVVDGDKVGRRIGYPTANIQMKHNKPPLSGIFAVELCGLPEGNRQAVASFGVRPTVKEHGKPTLEVHVFDFDRAIYGEHVRVDFLHKLRDEEKFPDMETLIAQIGRDVENAKAYFSRRGA